MSDYEKRYKEQQAAHDNELRRLAEAEELKALRDQFAMAALTGMLAGESPKTMDAHSMIEAAFEYADECMKKREKKV